VVRQCELLGIARSSYYYQPAPQDPYNLLLMRLLDEQYTRTPFYGSPKMTDWLRKEGHSVNHKRVERLMRAMGIQAIYPKPQTSIPTPGHTVYPYLLRGVRAQQPDHIWSCDITYIRMDGGFVYLMAVMDWFSRYVLSWSLSTTMEVDFCLEALDRALARGRPEIFNSDQGSQFTCDDFIDRLKDADVRISMDGRGRALDNIFVERLWRTVKYEEVYLKSYASVREARSNLAAYLRFYNEERSHQSLDYCTPVQVYQR
jgi:putative transposase